MPELEFDDAKSLFLQHAICDEKTLKELKGLERKALIEDLGDGAFTKIGMHDLWREFAARETRVGEFEYQCWIYEVDKSNGIEESTPTGGLWQHVKRMCFLGDGLLLVESIRLDHFSNITVLKLVAPRVNQQINLVLDVSKLIKLKSLELEMGCCGGIRIVGLRSLKNLLFLRLKDIGFSIDDIIDDIEHLRMLRGLILTRSLGDKLPNLSNLIFLEEVNFSECCNVTTICGLSSRLSKLRVLILDGCWKLHDLGPSARDLRTLQEFSLRGCVDLNEGQVIGKKRSQVFTLDNQFTGVRRWFEKLAPPELWSSTLPFDVGRYYYGVQKHRFNFEALRGLLSPPNNFQDLSEEQLSPEEQDNSIIRLARDYASTSAYARF
jgi:hypothetical protein